MQVLKYLAAASALAVLAEPFIAAAQETQSMPTKQEQTLSIERVFASPSLDGSAPRLPKLSPDGRYLTVLRNRASDRERYDLWAYDRHDGQWRMLVDSEKLASARELSEAEKMQRERQRIAGLKGIVTYDWSADGKSLLVPIEGDLYLAGLEGTVKRLTNSPEGELNPVLSQTGKYVSFVRDQRLWAGPVGGETKAVTPRETADTAHWGEAEFVAQEEMDRFTGYWWSPTDARIAVERFDEAPVGVVTRAAIGASGTKTFEQRYPAAGTPNVDVSLFVIDPDGGNKAEVDLGPDKDIYLTRVDWAPDGKALYVQRVDRGQTRLDMLAADPATGKSHLLFSETTAPGHWINLSDNYRFLKDGSLIWWSERDGYGHLYRFAGGKWQQLTNGPWVVTKLAGIDQQAHRLFFTATKDDVLAGQVYSLDYLKPAAPERLTDLAFANGASMDKQGKTLLVGRSSPSQPPQVYLADQSGKRLAWVEENKLDPDHPYAPYLSSHRLPKFGTIKGPDGTDLHWRMITPPLVAGKRYPVFFSHYGGPHSQEVTKAWGGALEQAIVDKGYIFFEIDNRGSSNRGVDFEKAIYRAMGGPEVADQKAGAEYLKTLDFVDPNKIAIYGWSYGGYMTMKQLEAEPGFYAAGIAVAPVGRWELYDTFYTERYMGRPQTDGEAYAKSSTVADAGKVKDPLLLIHGMSDDNVVFTNSTEIIAELQQDKVPFEMMLYPGATHAIAGPNLRTHLYETIFAFLDRHGVAPSK